MNAGRSYGRVVKSILETMQPGETLTFADENDLIGMLLAGIGFSIAMMEQIELRGGLSVNEQISMMLRAPDYTGPKDFVGARNQAREYLLRERAQDLARGPQEGQDGAGGGEEG